MWYVYILRCADNTLYTGITTDITRRVREHNTSNTKSATYTKYRRPVRLAHVEEIGTHADALRRERALKKLSKPSKELLCDISLDSL